MPFARPSLGALIRDAQGALAAQLAGSDPLLRRSSLGVLARVFGGLQHMLFGHLDWIVRMLIPDTAEAEYLERWARLYGLSRKPAVAAGGNVTLTGSSGATLPAGALLVRSDGALFATQADVTLVSGTATVAVLAQASGADGATDAGSTLALQVAVTGIYGTATVAAGGIAGGAPIEADADLRARLLARVRQPPQGGAAADYLGWALSVPGVTRVWVYPLNRGAGTVDVAFVMDGRAASGGSIIPLTADVAAVQAAINVNRPVCSSSVVFAPTAAPLNITITGLSPNTLAVRAAVLVELAAQIQLDAQPGGTIYRSRLDEAVSRATGETSHTMAVPAADVVSAAGAIAVLGTVTFA